MDDPIEQKIIERLVQDHGVPRSKVSREKMIATELGVDGDDAGEFLETLVRDFSVDLDDVLADNFWPEAGLFKSCSVTPISIAQLAELIRQRTEESKI